MTEKTAFFYGVPFIVQAIFVGCIVYVVLLYLLICYGLVVYEAI